MAGPQFRFYLTNFPRLFVEGNLFGVYLFGYGNFLSTADTVGLTINKHLSVNAGYQLGSRLVVTNNASGDHRNPPYPEGCAGQDFKTSF